MTRAPIDDLAVIKVDGDAMEPTLRHGDAVLIDRSQRSALGRDGIYAIRMDGCIQLKRISGDPVERRLTLAADNAAYPTLRGIRPEDVDVVGRVIWFARQIAA